MRNVSIGAITDYRIESAKVAEDIFLDVLLNQKCGLIFTADIIVFEEGLLELWSLLVDYIPYDIVIDISVDMHNDVSHSPNLLPFDIGKITAARLGTDLETSSPICETEMRKESLM